MTTVRALGIMALALVALTFLTVLLIALIDERRAARREIHRVERKIGQLMYVNMTPLEREREIRRIQAFEERKRQDQRDGA